jgi:hypothetical protein
LEVKIAEEDDDDDGDAEFDAADDDEDDEEEELSSSFGAPNARNWLRRNGQTLMEPLGILGAVVSHDMMKLVSHESMRLIELESPHAVTSTNESSSIELPAAAAAATA